MPGAGGYNGREGRLETRTEDGMMTPGFTLLSLTQFLFSFHETFREAVKIEKKGDNHYTLGLTPHPPPRV